MVAALKKYWQVYLTEACALGLFMISACIVGILLNHPASPVYRHVVSVPMRRILGGMAMGLTALYLFYSPWGKKSGTHMNPAVTLSFLLLHRIRRIHATWYIVAQFAGGALAVLLVRLIMPHLIAEPEVNYVVTQPGMQGVILAFVAEFGMAFLMFYTVLTVSNSKHADWTGVVAAILVCCFISIESPVSGMSINPARTLASALNAQVWNSWWIYFIAPVAGMLLAAQLFRMNFMKSHGGDCRGIKVHLSGDDQACHTYEVLFPPAS